MNWRVLGLMVALLVMAVKYDMQSRQLKDARSQLAAQTRAVESVSAASVVHLHIATAQLDALRPFEQQQVQIAQKFAEMKPSGATTCARIESVDRAFVSELRGRQ